MPLNIAQWGAERKAPKMKKINNFFWCHVSIQQKCQDWQITAK